MSYRGASQPAAPRSSMTVGYRSGVGSRYTTSSSSYGNAGGGGGGDSSGSGMFNTLSSGPTFERGHNTMRGTPGLSNNNTSEYPAATQNLLRAADRDLESRHRYGSGGGVAGGGTSSSASTLAGSRSGGGINPLGSASSYGSSSAAASPYHQSRSTAATSSSQHQHLASLAPPTHNSAAASSSLSHQRPPSASASYRSSTRALHNLDSPSNRFAPSMASSSRQQQEQRSRQLQPANEYDSDEDDTTGVHISKLIGGHSSSSSGMVAKSLSSSNYSNQYLPAASSSSSSMSAAANSNRYGGGVGGASSPSSVAVRSPATPARGPPVGLRNIGNTCYMNASLQCLINASGGFLHALEKERSSKLARALCGLAKSSNITDLMAVKGGAAHLNHEFHGGRQNDAHEFIREFVHALHIELNRVGKGAYKEMKDIDGESDFDAGKRWFSYFRSHDDSLVTDYFGGFMRNATVCGHCSHRSLSFSPVWDLSLSMASLGSSNNVPQMIRDFMKVETLGNDAAFHCEKCKKKGTGKRQSLLVNWPKVLVLHLCRFTYSGARNSHAVDFPMRLGADMIPMPSSGSVSGGADPDSGYSLSGVVLHRGTASFGHYTAMARPPGTRTWYNCDDSLVREVSESEVLRQRTEAYVLFYTLDE